MGVTGSLQTGNIGTGAWFFMMLGVIDRVMWRAHSI
jgi:hypothetical protein